MYTVRYTLFTQVQIFYFVNDNLYLNETYEGTMDEIVLHTTEVMSNHNFTSVEIFNPENQRIIIINKTAQ